MKFSSFLAAHAQRIGSKVALICEDEVLTFEELHRFSDRVGASLASMGIEPGDRVALYLPNRLEFAVCFFGIVKAGAVAVPVNTRLAIPEVAFQLDDSGAVAAFVDAGFAEQFDKAASKEISRIWLGGRPRDAGHSYEVMLANADGRLPDVPVAQDDCMISYTSGTTGTPKGAILTQANYIVMNGYLNAIYWDFSADDRILITTPLAHRTAFARLGNLLVLGATLVVLPKFDPMELSRIVRERSITVLGVVPTVARLLLPEIERAPGNFASLKRVLATGETFPTEIKARLLAALPDIKLFSFYSMTEAGVISLLGPGEQISHAASVGRVLPGLEVKLVDDELQRVQTGAVGEIWVRSGEPGRFLTMRGYLNRPETESFRDGWFATGDMGRFDEDGYLYIVDRKKDMILSGGYNIYSKEVENAIASHRDVARVAVVGVPDETFGEAVVAFVVRNPEATVTEPELVSWCTQYIASYKKPKHVRFVEELPENSTGKVLKKVLADRFFTL